MTSSEKIPDEGQMMPEFELPTTSGDVIQSMSFRNRNNLVIIFCGYASQNIIKQYSDDLVKRYKEFLAQDARILLVIIETYGDITPPRIHDQFPFNILIDKDAKAHKTFTSMKDGFGFLPVAYIVDRFGEIISKYSGLNGYTFPNIDEIINEVSFIALQCPE